MNFLVLIRSCVLLAQTWYLCGKFFLAGIFNFFLGMNTWTSNCYSMSVTKFRSMYLFKSSHNSLLTKHRRAKPLAHSTSFASRPETVLVLCMLCILARDLYSSHKNVHYTLLRNCNWPHVCQVSWISMYTWKKSRSLAEFSDESVEL